MGRRPRAEGRRSRGRRGDASRAPGGAGGRRLLSRRRPAVGLLHDQRLSARRERAPALLALIAAGALAPAAVGGKPHVVVGPGAVARTIAAGSYRVAVRISPNVA